MNFNNLINRPHEFTSKKLEWPLIILSSILLGIWAAKGTIALRNILLVIGTLLSLYYISLELPNKRLKDDLSLWKLLPLILIACCFLWVILHFFLFSIDPVTQFEELKSTWFRAFLASIVGLATGHALRNHPSQLNLLWLGILVAFLVLFFQYLFLAIEHNDLVIRITDHHSYLFHLKSNTVLIGMILLVGINSAFIDYLSFIKFCFKNLSFWRPLIWLLGTILVFWTFVFIADTRNGIGLSVIMYSFWFIFAITFFIHSKLTSPNTKNLPILIITCVGLSLLLYFAHLQMIVNKGWHPLFEDVKISVQIDHYPNWQDIPQLGYPKHEDGRIVTPNTYERVAWATAGARAIKAYPQGVGVLAFPFAKNPFAPSQIKVNMNSPGIATHSGWVELGLAFGAPILVLIFSALLLTAIEATRQAYPARVTVLSLVVLIFSLYAFSEIAIKHGIEILFYLLAFIPALLFAKPRQAEIGD